MNNKYLNICKKSLIWAKKRNFYGYSKFDALNSPLLYLIAKKSKFLRAAFVFGNSRMPVNIRPMLFVKKKQNPKGLALFARAYLNLFDLTKSEEFKNNAVELLDDLLEISHQNKFSGHCWGYEHPWQNSDFFIPPYEPNCVVTCAAAEAFLKAYKITNDEKYLKICDSIADFILNDLNQIDVGNDMLCCSYDLHSSWKVINVNAFASAFLAKLYSVSPKEEYKIASQKMMRWVISQKTDYHAWFYTDPPEASRITHDNYHTGFVLDSILEYYNVFNDEDILNHYKNGLVYYKTNLFTPDYAPKWMYNKKFPHDIHGAAQGIITFSKAAVFDLENLKYADNILNWALNNLYCKRNSRFMYQHRKFWKKKFTLMRWSQAWMGFALSEYIINMNRNK